MKKTVISIAVTGFIIILLGLAGLTGTKAYASNLIIIGLTLLLIDVFVPVMYELFFKK